MMVPFDGAMDTAVMRIGEEMGWFVERAGQRQRNLKTAGTIAALAWKAKPRGSLGSQEALANRLRELDAGDAFEWWLGAKGTPYLDAVAGVLKVAPADLIAWVEAARPTLDDDARWFRFEVFPGLSPLDLDSEDPYPGVPRLLWRGDGPRGPTWWHAPPGAGRTLVGRWLGRRHGWSFVSSPREAPDRAFIEHDGADLPDLRLPDRIVVASPHPMPDRLRQLRWEEVRGDTGWENALLAWVNDRVAEDGRFDAKLARRALAEGKLGASTPGALLEALAELEALGPELLAGGIPPAGALEAWARAHAGRADRAARPASRDWLREHGGWLLPRIELARLTRGLSVTTDNVLACMPTLPTASADAIQVARDAGDVEAALKLLRPAPSDLVAAMSALRWLLPGEWGLPSRVLSHLRAAVVDLALDELRDLRPLGTLLDTREVAADVVHGLEHPGRLAAWIDRLASGDPADPRTALVADGLLKAFALVAERRSMPMDGPALSLATALRAVYGEPCPDLGVDARVDDADVWTSISWLTLHRLGAFDAPAVERIRLWAWQAGLAIEWRDAAPTSTRRRIRGLAADTLGALTHADRQWQWVPRPVAALAALAHSDDPDPSALLDLGRLPLLEVLERLCASWAPSIEEVCRLLWPVWANVGLPDAEDPGKLAQVWATYSGDKVEGRLGVQLVEHAAAGVAIPDRLWPIAIALDPHKAGLLARAPLDALLASGTPWHGFIVPVVWARAPERALAVLREVLAGEVNWQDSAWLDAIPPDRSLDVVELLGSSASPSGKLAARRHWADRAIRERVPGWERVWEWVRAAER